MKKLFLFTAAYILNCYTDAQSVSIGNNTPNASAQLDVSSTNKGILIPRMSTIQKTAISNPALGLLVYDSLLNQFSFWTGSNWENIATASTCPPGFTKCGGSCVQLSSDMYNCSACGTVCPVGKTCVNGMCVVVCPAGFTNCGGSCVQLSNDMYNCSACGTVCPVGRTCVNGMCVIVCPAGFTNCNSSCVQITSDVNNCGGCGNACPAGKTCHNGTCL